MQVSATDGLENHTVSRTVVVNITDCNDNPPVFTQGILICVDYYLFVCFLLQIWLLDM